MRAFFIIAILMLASCNPKTKAVDSNPNKGQSTLTYAKHIDVQCYIVTREQLGEFLNQENPSITQLPTKELPHGLDVYFLIRVKNTGDMAASGILHCFVPSCGYPIPIKIMKMPKKMETYYDFITCFDTGLIWPLDPKPVITYEWDQLDCYPLK
jgi:hypothetical protein